MFLCNVHKCSFINPRSSLLMFEWFYKVCATFLSSDTSHSLLIWHSTISSGFKWISFCWVFPQRCYYSFALSPFAFCTRLCTTFWWYNFSNLNKILFPKQETKAFWRYQIYRFTICEQNNIVWHSLTKGYFCYQIIFCKKVALDA